MKIALDPAGSRTRHPSAAPHGGSPEGCSAPAGHPSGGLRPRPTGPSQAPGGQYLLSVRCRPRCTGSVGPPRARNISSRVRPLWAPPEPFEHSPERLDETFVTLNADELTDADPGARSRGPRAERSGRDPRRGARVVRRGRASSRAAGLTAFIDRRERSEAGDGVHRGRRLRRARCCLSIPGGPARDRRGRPTAAHRER